MARVTLSGASVASFAFSQGTGTHVRTRAREETGGERREGKEEEKRGEKEREGNRKMSNFASRIRNSERGREAKEKPRAKIENKLRP